MKVFYARIFDKQFKKLDRHIQKKVLQEIELLKADLTLGDPLTGDLRGLGSLHVKVGKAHYRVIYKLNKRKDKMLIIAVGPHKIYEWLKNYIRNVLRTSVERLFEI